MAHRSWPDLARGVVAALLLTVILAGLPVLLVVLSPAGFLTGAPAWDDIAGLLTRPDDGHLFLDALTLIGWIGWACFATSVATEVVSAARGLPAPHLPMLGLPQVAAAALVAAAAVLVTTTATSILTAPVVVSTAPAGLAAPHPSAPVMPNLGAASTGSPTPRPTPSTSLHGETGLRRHPLLTVLRGDTLWGLAVTHLGDGQRWREIYDLNSGRDQPDGRRLTETRWILPGWTLRLPADATRMPTTTLDGADAGNAAAGQGAGRESQSPAVHTVRVGDTLWDIAVEHFGDGARYRDVYTLNAGRTQPDGHALRDPDQINPGWHLDLPTPAGPSAPTPTSHLVQPPIPAPAPDTPTANPGGVDPDRRQPGGPAGEHLAPQGPSPAQGSQHHPPRPTAPTVVGAAADDDGWDAQTPAVTALVAGITAFAAAGAVGELARRRRRQQRLRHPGQRIPMPEPGTAGAELEQTLRATAAPVTLAVLKQTMRTLAIDCTTQRRPPPRLAAVLISADRIELRLVQDDHSPLAPFRVTGPRTWMAPVAALSDQAADRDDGGDTADDDMDVADPYPALVSIGVTDDAVVLINLEAVGTLTISGEPEQSESVLRAVLVELATCELSAGCSLTVGPGFADLAQVCDPTHVNVVAGAGLAARATARARAIGAVLQSSLVADVHEARFRGVAEDAWTPDILASPTLCGSPEPWSGVTALTCGDRPGPGWTLQLRPGQRARLEPLAIDLQASSLDSETYQDLLGLLRRADEILSHDHLLDRAIVEELDEPGSSDDMSVVLASLPADGAASPSRARDADTAAADTPRVLVLGPVLVEGADNSTGAVRRGRATELVTYLALHPGASTHQITEVMWPGQRVTKQNRNSFVSRVRHWLGETPDGQPYLAHVNQDGDYRLHRGVSCDWHAFLRLARAGLSQRSGGAEDLDAAMRLVRGRPFLGVDPVVYTWAEADTQEMISTIVDVAHTLANLRLRQGDARAAQAAAARGLLAEPASEVLYRDAMRAALLRGDSPEVLRLRTQLVASLACIDPDGGLEAETIELLATGSMRGT